jgi:hypothetical protein
MEVLAIALSVPLAIVASVVYCFVLGKVIARFETPSRWLRRASFIIVGLITLEFVLVLTVGAVKSRQLIGPGYYIVHLVGFFLGMPALANILLLSQRTPGVKRLLVAAGICAVFGVSLVFLQYHVSEALYGVDGIGGPYSGPSS